MATFTIRLPRCHGYYAMPLLRWLRCYADFAMLSPPYQRIAADDDADAATAAI